MQPTVRHLLTAQIDSLTKLEVALHFNAHPKAIETMDGLADRLCRDTGEIRRAVEGLAEGGVLHRYVLGAGHYVLYGLTDDQAQQRAIHDLSRVYHNDPDARVAIVKHVMGISRTARPRTPEPAV